MATKEEKEKAAKKFNEIAKRARLHKCDCPACQRRLNENLGLLIEATKDQHPPIDPNRNRRKENKQHGD